MVGSPHGSAPELSDSAIQNKTFSLTNAHKKQLGVSLNKRDKLTCVSKLRHLQGPSYHPFSWPFSCSVVYTPFYKTSRSTTHLNHPAGQIDSQGLTPQLVERDPLLTAGCQLPQVLKYKYAIQSDGGKVCQPIKIGDSLLAAGGQLPQVLTYKYTIQSDGGKVCQPIGLRDPLLAAGVQLRHSEKMPSDELMGTLSGIMLIADLNPNYYLKIW